MSPPSTAPSAAATPVPPCRGDGPATPGTPEANTWFHAEVRPHEPSLRRYLHGNFPVERDVDDVIQESFLRIIQAQARGPIASAKAFLYTIARNVVLGRLRRARTAQTETTGDLEALHLVAEIGDPRAELHHRERLRLLAAAATELPPRCREVFLLHRVQRLSRQETAERLGIAEKTVDVQTTTAMKKIAAYLRARGVHGLYRDE